MRTFLLALLALGVISWLAAPTAQAAGPVVRVVPGVNADVYVGFGFGGGCGPCEPAPYWGPYSHRVYRPYGYRTYTYYPYARSGCGPYYSYPYRTYGYGGYSYPRAYYSYPSYPRFRVGFGYRSGHYRGGYHRGHHHPRTRHVRGVRR